MRLGGDGTQRHGPGGKALDDLAGGSTSSRAMALAGSSLNSNRPQRHVAATLVVDDLGVFLCTWQSCWSACCAATWRWRQASTCAPFAAGAPGVLTACVQGVGQHWAAPNAAWCMRMASCAISNTPMPSTRLAVPVKYFAPPSGWTNRWLQTTARRNSSRRWTRPSWT